MTQRRFHEISLYPSSPVSSLSPDSQTLLGYMFHSDNRYIEEKSVEVVEFLDLIVMDHNFHLSLTHCTDIVFSICHTLSLGKRSWSLSWSIRTILLESPSCFAFCSHENCLHLFHISLGVVIVRKIFIHLFSIFSVHNRWWRASILQLRVFELILKVFDNIVSSKLHKISQGLMNESINSLSFLDNSKHPYSIPLVFCYN